MPGKGTDVGARRTSATLLAGLRGLGQAKPPSSSLCRLAAWLFIGPSLIGYVYRPAGPNVYLGTMTYLRTGEAGLIGLALLTLFAVVRGSVTRRATLAITATVAGLFGVVLAYAWLWPHIRGWAYGEPSQKLAIAAVLYCSAAVAYALVFYREDVFMDVFWKASVFTLGIALAAYLAYYVIGSGWLIHRQYGTPRLQGLLSEPSAWAPFLPALLLLALRHRRHLWTVVVFLIAAALTKSPTVLLSMAGAVAAYYMLRPRRRSRQLLVFGSVAAIGGLGTYLLLQVDLYRPVSSSLVDQLVVRLASGLRAVTTGGTVGQNDRFTSTQVVIHQLSRHGWMWFGIGPGSEAYMHESMAVLPNALPVYVLASLGIIGLLAFAITVVITVARLRKHGSLRVFLPFIVASLINSAQGWESYKYVIVAVVVSSGIVARVQLAGAENGSGSGTPGCAGETEADKPRTAHALEAPQ